MDIVDIISIILFIILVLSAGFLLKPKTNKAFEDIVNKDIQEINKQLEEERRGIRER